MVGLIALLSSIFCQLYDFAPHPFKRAILHPLFYPLSDLMAPHVFQCWCVPFWWGVFN